MSQKIELILIAFRSKYNTYWLYLYQEEVWFVSVEGDKGIREGMWVLYDSGPICWDAYEPQLILVLI
jgi:hypothetical protein